MTKIDLTQINLERLITHHVGNKLRDERYKLSNDESDVDEETENVLLKYFLISIKNEDYYSFDHPINLEHNSIFKIVKELFSDKSTFIPGSQNIAKLLYEFSMHPKIKEGELNIVIFSNAYIDDEVVDAIGIFKSEIKVPFIKMKAEKSSFRIQHEQGFEVKGLDKGCLIFNTYSDQGYKIALIGSVNKSPESQYWKDDFLKISPITNDFYRTNEFLGIAKQFLTNQLKFDNPEVSRTDQIDLLNRSVEYFKSHDEFVKKEFEKEVFQDSQIVDSFRKFESDVLQNSDFQIPDSFEISKQAVKKQARVFKSVLKLDKNFHIYIHGNRDLIEQGTDEKGRKYYKIYYNEEE